MGIYNFLFRDNTIGRGTGSTVFTMPFSLPLQSPISGAVAVRRLWSTYQPPQVYIRAPSVPTQGIGGLMNGITVLQPLVNKPGA